MADVLEADVAVVGAGLAGLVAARELSSRGRDPIVLEARDRVGGRTLNQELGGGKAVEIGGEWVGPSQDRILALAHSLGIDTFPTYYEGRNVLELEGKLRRYRGTIPRLAPHVLFDIARMRRALDRLSRQVPLEAPWTAPRAAELDSITLRSWLQSNARTRKARRMIEVAAGVVWGTRTSELSLLWVLFYIRSGGGFDSLLDTEGGAQQNRLVGGSQLISLRLCDELGDAVRLRQPVERIEQDGKSVTIESEGLTALARRAIVAMPPSLTTRIRFSPPLGGERDQLASRMVGGALTKCTAVYDEPFWRDDGLTGEAVSDAGPVETTFDNSPPDGSPGVMLGFIGAEQAVAHARLPVSERRRRVLGCLGRLFGDRAAHPSDYFEQAWAEEEWTRGGPVCSPGPGALTKYGEALRRPAGRVHWAGAETSTVWCGYMDGAVRSGERAAAEVMAAEGWTI